MAAVSRQPAQKAQQLGQLGLLDLDDDGDLLSDGGPGHAAFQVSPLGQVQRQQEATEDPAKIRVVVRKRPISRKEEERGDCDIVTVNMRKAFVVVNETKVKVDLTKYEEKHQFIFDESLDESVSNDEVYRLTVAPLVGTLFRNGRASCFAYGQTGSGKTYTMTPLPIRAAEDIFNYLKRSEYLDIQLQVSCFEIYGNKVFDLLNQRKKLNILEDGKRNVVVVGLKEFGARSGRDIQDLIAESGKNRSTGTTAANADSSRSHSIMQFCLKRPIGSDVKMVGKISFIDLAGSERGADTYDNNRQTRLEGAEINKSLLALKECIRALDSDARHVPFRGSKLTSVLKDSFIGDQARTVMIANISPCSTSVEHTLNTLRYADRVKELRKEKNERAPGGVTPGDAAYNYAALRGAGDVPEPAAAAPRAGRGLAPPFNHHVAHQPAEYSSPLGKAGDQDEELAVRHDELMDSILMEEEALVIAHRQRLEEDMEMMRNEMGLLQDVDQPGSSVDIYVEKLTALLNTKVAGIHALMAKVEAFKAKLREEETLSRTVQKQRGPT